MVTPPPPLPHLSIQIPQIFKKKLSNTRLFSAIYLSILQSNAFGFRMPFLLSHRGGEYYAESTSVPCERHHHDAEFARFLRRCDHAAENGDVGSLRPFASVNGGYDPVRVSIGQGDVSILENAAYIVERTLFAQVHRHALHCTQAVSSTCLPLGCRYGRSVVSEIGS